MGFVAEPLKEGYFATGGIIKFGGSLYLLLDMTQNSAQRLLFLFLWKRKFGGLTELLLQNARCDCGYEIPLEFR
jgi:hypothetical protein